MDEMLCSGEIVLIPEAMFSVARGSDVAVGVLEDSTRALGVDDDDVVGLAWLLSRRRLGASLILGCV